MTEKSKFDLPERHAIQQETSEATLLQWHDEIVDLFDVMKSQIAAHNMIEDHSDEDYDWADRAKVRVAYVGTALRRVERRMVALGYTLPVTVARAERDYIRYLSGLVGFLQRLCDSHDIEHGTRPVSVPKKEADLK
jgi:hypothetical protein